MATPPTSDLLTNLRQRGAALGRMGLSLSQIAVDLDETLWDWCMPLLRQTRWPISHREWIFVRQPLLALLHGIGGGPLNAWTAGYGYRVDRICQHEPLLSELLDLYPDQGHAAEQRPNIVTRLDFISGMRSRPELIPHGRERWVSQKIPGFPSAAQKPLVDQARVLLDDRESNCRRYVAGGQGRSAIWLRGTPRVWKANLPLRGIRRPPQHSWAGGVADALEAIAVGRTSVYVVDPEPGDFEQPQIVVDLPHRRAYRDWIAPGREVRDFTRELRQKERE